MYIFGSGTAIITPSGTNPTPLNFGLLQDISMDVTQTNKTLFGQYKDPIAIGGGTRKWTGKAKLARFSMRVLNQLMFGATMNASQIAEQFGESRNIPTTPFTITVTNSATYTTDLGVIYGLTGLPLKRVASAPTTGQYAVTAGVYTFAAADTGLNVLISYVYTVAATGQNFSVANTLIGNTITFGINTTHLDPTTNTVTSLYFANCVSNKFTFGTKLEDFAMPEFSFDMYADSSGQIFVASTPNQRDCACRSCGAAHPQ